MIVFDQLKKNDPHLRAVTWVVLIGMAILLAGLWWVQIISYRHYSENQKAQSFRTVRIPAIRGKILDRHGQALAENQPSYNVSLYLEELRDLFKAEWRHSQPPLQTNRHRLKIFGLKLFEWQNVSAAYKLTTSAKRALAEQGRYH